MGLKKAEGQVKMMLEDTILALCRNTLNYRADINIEGIIGVTLDNEEIFLVNINQSFKNPDSATDQNEMFKKRTAESDDVESSDSCSECSVSGEKKEKKRRRRRKRIKRKNSEVDCDVLGPSKYFHNDKENGCVANLDEEQRFSSAKTDLNGENQDAKSDDMQHDIENIRGKDHDFVAVKEEVSEFLHIGTQFAHLYNSFTTPGFPDLGHHGFPLNAISPGACSSLASPTPLSMSQNIPPAPASTPRTPVAKKSTASPRQTPGSPEKATCQLCGRVCVSRSKLIIHMRVHTGEKPFICFVCGRGCVQKSDLNKHLKTVHKMNLQALNPI